MTVFRVAVSAGHNPEAQGAKWREATEFDFTIPWQEELIKQLNELETVEHLYVRTQFVETGGLRHKVEQIKKVNGDLAIEIHFNAGAKTNGCETLFAPDSKVGKAWAKMVHVHLVRAMGNKNRGVKEGWYKMDQPGVVDYAGDVDGDEKPDYFLAKTRMPALILEPEFMFSIANAQEKMVEACAAIVVAVNDMAERKLYEENMAPEDKVDV